MKTLLERRRGESKFDRSRIHEREKKEIDVQTCFFSDCLRTKQSFKICLKIVIFLKKKTLEITILNLRETQHDKGQVHQT